MWVVAKCAGGGKVGDTIVMMMIMMMMMIAYLIYLVRLAVYRRDVMCINALLVSVHRRH